MLTHPQFDPIAFSVGPLAVRWYGLMYVVGFIAYIALGKWRARRDDWRGISPREVDDMLLYGVIGVILGGRLGYVLFYKPEYYLSKPLEILQVWTGGMSFHGGFLGVLVGIWLFCRLRHKSWLRTMDFIAPLVPIGLAAGRMGNFINGELWGRVSSVPWAMVFPQSGSSAPRHPSQLYQFLGLLELNLSMGQWLSAPMILAGFVMMAWAYKRESAPVSVESRRDRYDR